MAGKKSSIARLAFRWREIKGVKPTKYDFGFIGKLCKLYGEDVVEQAIEKIKNKPNQAENISRPLEYLRGVCRSISMQNNAPVKSEAREEFMNMLKDLL